MSAIAFGSQSTAQAPARPSQRREDESIAGARSIITSAATVAFVHKRDHVAGNGRPIERSVAGVSRQEHACKRLTEVLKGLMFGMVAIVVAGLMAPDIPATNKGLGAGPHRSTGQAAPNRAL